jgi:hypothetical protein
MTGENIDQTQPSNGDNRAPWERPALRRLTANSAEGGSSNLDDGNCSGTGNDNHHSCKVM